MTSRVRAIASLAVLAFGLTVPVAGALTTASAASTSTPPPPVGIPGQWKIVLDSEFSGRSLNTATWQTGWFGSGVTSPVNSNEQDCYSPSNVSFPGDGTLHLSVTAHPSTCGGVTKPDTGAIITTNPADGRKSGGFQYTYGVLEARIYIPADGAKIANWPAIWTDGQSWPTDGEDDVLEGLDGIACATFHGASTLTRVCDSTIKPGWHTFASDWQPGSISYYYDGVEVGSATSGITSAPMYIILDNTMHTGYTSVNAAATMKVQYVRVWQAG